MAGAFLRPLHHPPKYRQTADKSRRRRFPSPIRRRKVENRRRPVPKRKRAAVAAGGHEIRRCFAKLTAAADAAVTAMEGTAVAVVAMIDEAAAVVASCAVPEKRP